MSPLEFLIYFVLGALSLIYLFRKKSKEKNYPPGPWGIPILGHLPFVGTNIQETFMKWSKIYGPVIAVDLGSFPTVVINDPKLIRTAFNDHDFAGRPNLPTFLQRSGGEAEGVICSSGKKWMEQRRFVIRTLRDFGFGTKTMEATVQEEIKDLIEGFRKVVGKPVSTQNRFNAAVLNALWTIIAGERFKQDDPELQIAIKHLTSNIQNQNATATVAQFFPILVKLAPKLLGFDKLIKDNFPMLEFLKKPIEEHKATFLQGQPRDFIDVYLEEMKGTSDPASSFYKENGEKSILFSILDLFIAGAETTSTTLTWTFLYLAKYPQVQSKLQSEIQRVVGDSRLPSLNDRPNMPYTEAVIHEVLRYCALVPLGVVHNTNTDVELGGFTIPKDTMIMGNIYAVHFDQKIWEDPHNFRPERFLNKDRVFVKNEAFLAFSVGKRACPGESLARDELFLFTVSLFQAFTVSPVGTTDELSIDPHQSVVLSPKPHQLILTERN